MQKDLTLVNRDFSKLHPLVAERAQTAIAEANADGYPIKMFEGYRAPERQDFLFSQNDPKKGKWVTSKRAWGSWHQYGFALDVALYINNRWSWKPEEYFDKVAVYFKDQGFTWLFPKEKVHFEMTFGLKTSEAFQKVQKDGLRGLWDSVTL